MGLSRIIADALKSWKSKIVCITFIEGPVILANYLRFLAKLLPNIRRSVFVSTFSSGVITLLRITSN